MAPAVPVNLITGFLGSGKTTLLRHVLEHGLAGRRVAVIVNEIGDVGIDGRLIEGLDNVDQMVELNSGCICCSPGLQFGLAVQEILETVKPELLVIETTGTAQVSPLVREVEGLGLRVDAVSCVVDAEHVERHLVESVAARDQVCHADFVVVNKCDLVDERSVAKASKRLVRVNRRAIQHRTEFGRVSYDLLFATAGKTFRERAAAAGSHADHLAADGIESFVFESGEPFRAVDPLQSALGDLPREVYRVKGVAAVGMDAEQRMHLVNVTCGRVNFDLAPAPLAHLGRTSLVVIGRGVVSNHRRVIEQRLSRETGSADRSRWARPGFGTLFPGGRG
jgi:cobalamin biosynthesis protein CobW